MVVKRESPADNLAAAADPRISAAFPNLRIAGPLDDIEAAPLEVTMTEDWIGYLNIAVMGKMNELCPSRITHVQLLPDVKSNLVILVPCEPTDYGAAELKYSATEAGALVNLRLAVQALKVTKLANRVRIFKVTTRPGSDGLTYVAFSTKSPKSRPAKVLKKEEGPTKSESQGS
jgi:hypothetical protein